MKKFVVFILYLLLLIISEYFLVSELFGDKRPLVIAISLAALIIFFAASYRFFKKSFIAPGR